MKAKNHRLAVGAVAMAALVFLTAGCHGWGGPRKTEKSSSVVDYLYPRQQEPLVTPGVPVLRLPLRVGLAFVPSGGPRGSQARHDFSEQQKNELLARVADQFREHKFIQSIEIIPTTYLRPGGGFENLDQVRSLLGLDVVALVAYDQLQFTDQNKLSLAYWTIVGAYLIKGNRNDTHTLLEAVVYDIPSRKLLFRAPGANQIGASSTVVEVDQRLRQDSTRSFDLAANDLIANLKKELAAFQERVKSAPAGSELARIEHRPGYTGGGTTGPLAALLLLLVLAAARRAGRGEN
jgi:rhombotail lipoprotein